MTLSLSTLLVCTAACDNIIMHYAKKYLLSSINLAPDNFSGCPVVFVWCDAVNNHYFVTFSTPFIVCSLPHLPFSRLKSSHLFIIPLQKLFPALVHPCCLHLCFSTSTLCKVKEPGCMQRFVQHGQIFVETKQESRL